MTPEPRPRIQVVAAAIEDPQRRVLIAQRPAGKHLAGAWEFPGGKVEPGEPPLLALARELREELGIKIGSGPHRPVRRVNHSYPERDVRIDVWRVKEFSGIARGLDSQALRWCSPDELQQAAVLAADKPIVAALRLPEILTEESTEDYSIGVRQVDKQLGLMCQDFDSALAAEHSGADFVVMRLQMPDAALARLAGLISVPLFARGVSLDAAWQLGVSGIYEFDRQPTMASAIFGQL